MLLCDLGHEALERAGYGLETFRGGRRDHGGGPHGNASAAGEEREEALPPLTREERVRSPRPRLQTRVAAEGPTQPRVAGSTVSNPTECTQTFEPAFRASLSRMVAS